MTLNLPLCGVISATSVMVRYATASTNFVGAQKEVAVMLLDVFGVGSGWRWIALCEAARTGNPSARWRTSNDMSMHVARNASKRRSRKGLIVGAATKEVGAAKR